MIALYLLAAHLVGDFVLQTRWQAVGKFGWDQPALGFRTRHVVGYSLCFVPIAAVYASSWDAGATFVAALFVLHWLTDAQRFSSTLGETLAWRYSLAGRKLAARYGRVDLAPNPWEPIGLALDQTLHLVQVAVLAGLLLS